MATADDYAAWIVQNAAKRGTPDFDTVAQAYQEAKSEENMAATQAQLAPIQPTQPQGGGVMDTLQGIGETALTLGTGAIGGTVGMITGAGGQLAREILSGEFGTQQAQQRVSQAAEQAASNLTYAPRGQAGQENIQAIGGALQGLPAFIPVVGPVGAMARSAQATAPLVQATAQATAQRAGQIAQRGAQATGRATQAAREAIGMAPSPTAAKPTAGSVGAAVTPLETQRIAEAQQAGLRLSEGEVKRSQELMAFEAEKARTPDFQEPFVARQLENNKAALGKFETLLDDTGAIEPGSGNDFSNTGVKVVDTLMQGWKDEKKKTSAMYDAFKNSPEAQTVVNPTPLIDFLNTQPKQVSGMTGVSDVARQNAIALGIAAPDVDGQLKPLNTTLGNLEEFRKSVNANSGTLPNDKRVALLLKQNIDAIGEPIAGPMVDAMRAQRRKQATKYENRAIVSRLLLEKRGMDDPQTPPELVFQKTILNSQPSEILRIKRVLNTIGDGEGKQAWKELQGSTIRHLMQQAESGIGSDNLPVISGAKLDAALKNLYRSGKLDMVLGKEAAEQVRNLNQVLKYIQSTPPLTSINNSGTARTIMALMGESALQGAVTGVPLPILQGAQMLRKEIADRKIRNKITQALNYMPKKE